jgi:hypothetical protein
MVYTHRILLCIYDFTLLYYIVCFCARVALDDMGLIGGTLLYYIICFCAIVALDDIAENSEQILKIAENSEQILNRF